MVIMPKNCYDKNKNWCHTRKVMCRAAKNDGDYVQQNCPRMCGLCIQDCWDEDDQCKQWKREGYCKTRDRVKKICPKTCFNCEGEDEDKIPCTCGLPQHLLIPQGRPEGMPFQFLVFATKHDETNKPPPSSCTDSECSDLCAIDHMECLGYSDEPMGFPFDRPLTRIGNIRMNNINDFDSALPNAKLLDVKIYHQDIVKNKSECIF
ncbi:unnamed protein product [Meganyctiphanes norvegica]|uniref:ShKT domain-containing protein n=1 Tax=Meganyctiphanes norvegica TaxID=48144 RepID=A0AAV2SEP2_MEGNR